MAGNDFLHQYRACFDGNIGQELDLNHAEIECSQEPFSERFLSARFLFDEPSPLDSYPLDKLCWFRSQGGVQFPTGGIGIFPGARERFRSPKPEGQQIR